MSTKPKEVHVWRVKDFKYIGKYPSISQTALALGINERPIKCCLSGSSNQKDKNGYKFRRITCGGYFFLHFKPDDIRSVYVKVVTDAKIMPKLKSHISIPKKDAPKILLIDIETAPIIAAVWGVFKQNIGIDQILHDKHIICWSAKWLYDDYIYSDCLTPKEALRRDDKRITMSVYDMINAADIVVGHNSQKFDVPIITGRFLQHKLPPVNPFQQVDTCLVARKNFGFTSNKLDFINRILDLKQKVDTGGFGLWLSCMNGDQEALDKMREYNENDVLILEDNYLTIRPYIKSHPNLALYQGEDAKAVCPNCGSENLKTDNGYYYTPVNKYATFKCLDCGAIGHERVKTHGRKASQNIKSTCAR